MLPSLPGTQVGSVNVMLVILSNVGSVMVNVVLMVQPLASVARIVYVLAAKLVNKPVLLV